MASEQQRHDIERIAPDHWQCKRCKTLWCCDPDEAPPEDTKPEDWHLEDQNGRCYAAIGEVDREQLP